MFKDNLTFGYVLFVGIPLLILIGTLRAGAGLSAPSAVSGDWIVETMPNKCAGSLADANPTSLSIYQTGVDLRISCNNKQKTPLAGHLESVHIGPTKSTPGCVPVLRHEAALPAKPGQRCMQ